MYHPLPITSSIAMFPPPSKSVTHVGAEPLAVGGKLITEAGVMSPIVT